jgi:flavodoxin
MAVHTSREVDSFEDLAVHTDTSGQANSSQGLTGHSERKLFMKTVENTSLAQAFSENNQRLFLHIVFASTSGHTEYVVDALIKFLRPLVPRSQIAATRAEKTQSEDLLRGDVLVLASSTWNTGSVEGQLNPHMWVLLQEKAKNLDLAGKPCTCIGLGDDRYFYTARAADLLQFYVKTHRGRLILPTLRVINEPYGQEGKIRVWANQLAEASKRVGWS